VGFANWRNLEHNARFFYAFELNWLDLNAEDDKPSNINEKFSFFMVLVILGIEADAREWLRMRASVRQNILIGHAKSTEGTATGTRKFENAPNDTSVAFGVGSSLNKFNFDVTLVQTVGGDNGRAEASLTYLF